MMNPKQREALKEALVTVGTGFIINWPISIIFLYLFIDLLKLDILTTSVFMTFGFTVVAVIRVYLIRMWFSQDD